MIQETKLTFCEWLKYVNKPCTLISKLPLYSMIDPNDIIQILEPRRAVKIGDLTISEYLKTLKQLANEYND